MANKENDWKCHPKLPLGLILSVLTIAGGQIYSLGVSSNRFDNLEDKVSQLDGRHQQSVITQLATRDLQIEVLAKDVRATQVTAKENQKLLQAIAIKIARLEP